ncbi:MAG: hypothetical protein HYR85_20760 [Planctomycetes bacterium]|nr:hypothetical protein [Planctomycetota bacterium]MBI3846931.1 hypothetical protein [Planctomycetota bacterium]
MMIKRRLYLEEMDTLLADAKRNLITESPDTEVYTVSIWTDPNSAVSTVSFDTQENSVEHVRQSNEWNKKYYDEYMAEGDTEQAALFLPVEGRNENPADFRFREIATVKHRSFAPENAPMQIAGGDSPVDSAIWPALEPLLQVVQERARSLFRDLRLHAEARLAINSPEAWYDHEIPMAT